MGDMLLISREFTPTQSIFGNSWYRKPISGWVRVELLVSSALIFLVFGGVGWCLWLCWCKIRREKNGGIQAVLFF